jgi:hypothetical protein
MSRQFFVPTYRHNGHEFESRTLNDQHPVDDLEPEISQHEAYKLAAQKFTKVMLAAFSHVESVLFRPNATMKDVMVAFWQVAYPLGISSCGGLNMTERAEELDVERATISKFATTFCRGQGIPPSFYMKGPDAPKSYQTARCKSIISCNKNSKPA